MKVEHPQLLKTNQITNQTEGCLVIEPSALIVQPMFFYFNLGATDH